MNNADESTVDRVRAIVRKNLKTTTPELDDATDLFVAGLDSMSSMDVIMALETEFGIQFDLGDIRAENFRSVHELAALVKTRQS